MLAVHRRSPTRSRAERRSHARDIGQSGARATLALAAALAERARTAALATEHDHVRERRLVESTVVVDPAASRSARQAAARAVRAAEEWHLRVQLESEPVDCQL